MSLHAASGAVARALLAASCEAATSLRSSLPLHVLPTHAAALHASWPTDQAAAANQAPLVSSCLNPGRSACLLPLTQARVAMADVLELLEAAEAKAYYGLAINWKPLQALTQALLDRGVLQVRGSGVEGRPGNARSAHCMLWGSGAHAGAAAQGRAAGAGSWEVGRRAGVLVPWVKQLGASACCMLGSGACAPGHWQHRPLCKAARRACRAQPSAPSPPWPRRARRWRTSWKPTASSTSLTPSPAALAGTREVRVL